LASCITSPSSPMLARPRGAMRIESGPASASRRQTGIEAPAGTSSTNPSRGSFPITLPAALPLRLGVRTMAPSSRREAADSSTSWVSVSVMGSSFGWRRRRAPSPPKPRNRAYSRRGRSQERRVRSTRPQQSRSVCSGNPVLYARKYGFIGCFGRCEQLLVATRSSFSKGTLQNDIFRFESSHPSHAVRSLLCDFRVGENRRHSRGLGGRAAVSGQQIPKFPVWTSGFVAPVSAHHFPISVSARPRPVRYLTETGLQSCVSSVAVTRDVGMKSATSRVSAISALGGSRCHLIAPAFAGPPTPDGRKPGRIRVVPLIADRFKAAGLTIGVVWSCGRVGLSICPLPFAMPVALRPTSAGAGNRTADPIP